MTSTEGVGEDGVVADAEEVGAFLVEQREQRVRSAQAAARRSWGMSIIRQGADNPRAKVHAQEAIARGAEAFWLAEDSDLETEMHEDLDKYGRWKREKFGCSYLVEDGTYYQTCPCAIAHTRVGLSPGMLVTERICAICQLRFPEECKHRAGRLYWVEGGRGPRGLCQVCGSNECQEHTEGVRYRTLQVRVVMEAELEEISIVRRPANPLARMTKIPVSWNSIEAENPGVKPGSRVSCNRCLFSCEGILDPIGEKEGQRAAKPSPTART
jgi:hypothetical protein